jgi:hypothetical protein
MRELRQAGATFSEIPFGSMRLVWKYGRAAEAHVRETLMLDPQMKKDAYGLWKCRCRHTVIKGHHVPNAKPCNRCGTAPDRYDEITFIDKEYAVSGNPDFIYKDGPLYRVVEIKSIKADTTSTAGFYDLTGPVPLHVEQGTHYVKLGQRDGLRMHRRPQLLYVNKGFSPKSWYKPFIPSDALTERSEQAVKKQRAVTREFGASIKEGAPAPMIQGCIDNPSSKQKSCPAWAECMARRTGQ